MVTRFSLCFLLVVSLSGCPQSPDRCAEDPSRCTSGVSSFALNPDCPPSGPLTVRMGDEIYGTGFVAFEYSNDFRVDSGGGFQGGLLHTDLSLRVEGVDVEKSPRLRASLHLLSRTPSSDCSVLTPTLDWEEPDYMLFYRGIEAGGQPPSPMITSQSGCTSRGCGEGQVCSVGIGCVPSACFVGSEVMMESNEGMRCAHDCAGGMCVEEGLALEQDGCSGRECGNDGQGGMCGQCGADEVCSLEGQCVASCPNEDGCGAYCTPCSQGLECLEGFCGMPSSASFSCVSLMTRLFVVGKSSALELDSAGRVLVSGIRIYNPHTGPMLIRVEDMCGNVGVHTLVPWEWSPVEGQFGPPVDLEVTPDAYP